MIKKHKFIFFQTMLCLLVFINNWFGDLIINRYTFLTTFIINLLLFIGFVKLFIIIFKNFKQRNNIQNLIRITLLILTIILSVYDFRFIKSKLELSLYMEQRMHIIEKIKNNEFIYYYENNIKLPVYNYVSSDGEVYVYQNDKDQVIGFWVFRGMQSGSTQIIYSSKDENLIYDNECGHTIEEIIKLEEHWYYVITNY